MASFSEAVDQLKAMSVSAPRNSCELIDEENAHPILGCVADRCMPRWALIRDLRRKGLNL